MYRSDIPMAIGMSKKKCMSKGGEAEAMKSKKGMAMGGVAKVRKGEMAKQMKATPKKGK